MTMMHLKYPRKRGYFYWDELGCLARALGFEPDVFFANIPDEDPNKQQPCIHIQELLSMMDVYKYYHRALDKSYNLHSEEWNLAAAKKAFYLLSQHLLTFQALHSMRVAYQVYESVDMKGLLIEEHTLLRALKMCGRTAAPLKLMHRIKHIRHSYDEDGRIQLHEFLDLVLWCDLYEKMTIEGEKLEAALSRDDRKLYKLDDFHQVLSPYDERLADYLNAVYLAKEWQFGREKLGSKEMCREPPIKTEGIRRQVKYHKDRYVPLHAEMADSEMRVYTAAAGYVRPRPISAPDLDMYKHTDMNADSTERFRPHTVYTSLSQQLSRSRSRSAKSVEICNMDDVFRPLLAEYQRSRDTPSLITHEDKSHAETLMEDIRFELETNETKHEICLKNDKDYILPGYKEKLPVTTASPAVESLPVERAPRVDADTINRLTYPVSRVPPPSHAKSCDARHRGWHPVKTKKGPHLVLASTKYSSSPKLKLIDKLQRNAAAQLGSLHRKHIFRYTRPSQVELDRSESRSAKTETSTGSSEKHQAWEEVYNNNRRPSTISRTSAAVSEQTDSSDKDEADVKPQVQTHDVNKSHTTSDAGRRVSKVGHVAMLENIVEEGTTATGAKMNPGRITLTKFMEKYNSVDANIINNKLMHSPNGGSGCRGDPRVKNSSNCHNNRQVGVKMSPSQCKNSYMHGNLSNKNHINIEKTLDCGDVDFRDVANEIIKQIDQMVFDPDPVVIKSVEEKRREVNSRRRLAQRVSGRFGQKIQSFNGAV